MFSRRHEDGWEGGILAALDLCKNLISEFCLFVDLFAFEMGKKGKKGKEGQEAR